MDRKKLDEISATRPAYPTEDRTKMAPFFDKLHPKVKSLKESAVPLSAKSKEAKN